MCETILVSNKGKDGRQFIFKIKSNSIHVLCQVDTQFTFLNTETIPR